MITSRAGRDGTQRLAGDEHTAIWARRRIRQQRLDVLRANARSFVTAVVVSATLIAVVALLVPWRFVQGLIVDGGITALLSMIGFLVLALSGTTARGMGTTAETWTAAELRRHGWRLINGLVVPRPRRRPPACWTLRPHRRRNKMVIVGLAPRPT